ncbi:unnamed protein product [Debaryomyces fabryi]|nr:unnamed protein product [Debaryomyces fabryi]
MFVDEKIRLIKRAEKNQRRPQLS